MRCLEIRVLRATDKTRVYWYNSITKLRRKLAEVVYNSLTPNMSANWQQKPNTQTVRGLNLAVPTTDLVTRAEYNAQAVKTLFTAVK
jgi:hypothetical protein